MERWSALILLLTSPIFAQSVRAQYTSYLRNIPTGPVTVIMSEVFTSNNNSSGISVTPLKKTLTNCATGYSGGVLQPSGFPVGQLYCNTADQTAGEGAGGPTQGIVNPTISGTGTVAIDNGHGAGGTDSPTDLTASYGNTTDDTVCSGDPQNPLPTLYTGLPSNTCGTGVSATFTQITTTGHPNADSLFTGVYVSNSTTLDQALYYELDQYFCIDNLSTLHDFEFEGNINSSPTAYGAGNGGFFGWGFHWNTNVNMFQYCPQNCSAWKTVKGLDVAGGPALTSYSFTNGHCYRTVNTGHRMANCSFTSATNCAFYDYFTIYDETASAAPKTYLLVDALSGLLIGFIPVDNHTFSSGLYDHVQLDMTSVGTTQVRVINHTLRVFSL